MSAAYVRRMLRLIRRTEHDGHGIGSTSRRLRYRRGVTHRSDALSSVVVAFVFLVVLGIGVSWSYFFWQVIQKSGEAVGGGGTGIGVGFGGSSTWWRWKRRRPPAPRDAKRRSVGWFGVGNRGWGAFRSAAVGAASRFWRWAKGEDSSWRTSHAASDARLGALGLLGEEEEDEPSPYAVERLKLPGPIIVVGMPKSGTTSIHSYFRCGGRKSSHFACEASSSFTAATQVPPPPISTPNTGEPWRNCRLPYGAGGPGSSLGEYPLCGVCVRRNVMRGRPPLEGCGDYEVWSELDSAEHPLPTVLANRQRIRREREEKAREEAEKVAMMERIAQLENEGSGDGENETKDLMMEELRVLTDSAHLEASKNVAKTLSDSKDDGEEEEEEEEEDSTSVRPLCSFPQISYLEEIHAAYPNATFILNLRPVDKWIRSVSKWTGDKRRSDKGFLRQVLTRCDFPNFPSGKGDDDADLEAFYLSHSNRVRDFVRTHPSHVLVEVNIEDHDAGKTMEDAFGISSECWTVRNASPQAGARGWMERGRYRERMRSRRRRRDVRSDWSDERDRRHELRARRVGRETDGTDGSVERLREMRRERYGQRREISHVRREERTGKDQDAHGDWNKDENNNNERNRDESQDKWLDEGFDRDRAALLQDKILTARQRRREWHREEWMNERDEMWRTLRAGPNSIARRFREGTRRNGKSKFRYSRYPICENVEDLFQ